MAEGSKSVEGLCIGIEGLSGLYGGKSRKTSAISSETSSYLGDSVDKFPSNTSKWKIFCLESLGIFYNKTFHDSPQGILNMIFEETGAFRPLSEDQMCHVEDLKKSITFNFPISEITEMLTDKEKVTMSNGDSFFLELEKDIDECTSADIREFLFSCQLMLSCRAAFFYDWRENVEPVDMYVNMLQKFSRLCQLIPLPGSAKKTTMTLQNISITSEADLVMIPERCRRSTFSARGGTTYVVSIAQVKNLSLSKSKVEVDKAAWHMKTSVEAGDPPQIYTKVHTDILAQHGGDLLIHRQLYCNTDSSNTIQIYLTGMIVVGSEVIFTLMKIHRHHLQQIKEQGDITFRATIYYSKPLDLLKKEERDELVESFTRLSNV